MARKMKLFVWEGQFKDYTPGLAVVLAHDIAEARDKLENKIGYHHDDIDQEPKMYELNEPIAFFVYGGS